VLLHPNKLNGHVVPLNERSCIPPSKFDRMRPNIAHSIPAKVRN
jgi:hypothetical protein